MRCPRCGKEVERGAAFCTGCGMKLSNSASGGSGNRRSGNSGPGYRGSGNSGSGYGGSGYDRRRRSSGSGGVVALLVILCVAAVVGLFIFRAFFFEKKEPEQEAAAGQTEMVNEKDTDTGEQEQKKQETAALETGTLTGKVVDKSTGRPVSGARIKLVDEIGTIYPEGGALHSDSSGEFEAELPEGTYTITVTISGYDEYYADDPVVIAADETSDLGDIELKSAYVDDNKKKKTEEEKKAEEEEREREEEEAKRLEEEEEARQREEEEARMREEEERAAKADNGSYLLPDSASRMLKESDIKGLSEWELKLARNEIYARHGRRFNDPDLQSYFDNCTWYRGVYEPEEFDRDHMSDLNEYEKKNAEFILQYEKDHGLMT